MKKISLLFTIFTVLFSFVFTLYAADDSEKKEKAVVTSGVLINRIDSFDIKTGEALIDFWYWSVAEFENQLSTLELCNGHLEPQLMDTVRMEKDGLYYESQRYLATVYGGINLNRFPFDQQTVSLVFEDSNLTEDDMIFKPDLLNSGYDKQYQMCEWDIKKISYSVKSYRYETSFGYLDIPSGQGSTYSRLCVDLELDRRGSIMQKVFKYFWTIFVSVIVGLLAMFISVKNLGPRFSMAIGSLFANVGCSYTLSEKLPKSPSPTCAEIISYISLGIIFIVLAESILSLTLYNHGKEHLSKKLDHGTFFLALIAYGVSCAWMIYA